MPSPSSVTDPSTGNNYGGIRQDALGVNSSYQQYIDNLFDTVSRPVAGPLSQQQYTPSASKSPVIGQISNQTLGSLPIFGSGAAIFPQAVLDNYARAQKDAELQYLNEIGDVSLNEFQLSSTLKNPWHNQAFSSKYQSSLDAWLDASAGQFGGDYMKGMKALQGNKDFLSLMKSYDDYANIYNSVFDDAVGILSADPEETYVSDVTRKSAQKFIHDYEQLDELPIDELVRRARNFKTHVSINKVADIAMDGMGERIFDSFQESKTMGTAEMKVVIKETEKGPSQEDLDEIYNLQLEAYPWIKDDKTAQSLLKVEIQKRADKVYEQSIEKIKKENAGEASYMRKNGIKMDKSGKVQTVEQMPTAFAQFNSARFQVGKDGIQYPPRDMSGKPVELQTVSGMRSYIIDPATGSLYYATLPGSYNMTPQKEYTLADSEGQNEAGRFVEGTITFEDVGIYSREFTKAPIKEGEVQQSVGTGGRTTMASEKRPVIVKDIYTGNQVELYGTYQVVTHFDNMKDELNVAYPFLQRTHEDLKNTEQKGIIGGPRPADTGKVQTDTAPAGTTPEPRRRGRKGKVQQIDDSNVAATLASASPGDTFEYDGKLYEWDGTNLNPQ